MRCRRLFRLAPLYAFAVSLTTLSIARPAVAGPLPDATRDRIERASRDPLLEPWQRDFFKRRLDQAASAPEATARGPVAPPTVAAATAALPIWSLYVRAPEQAGHVALYDPFDDRILIVGGETPGGLTSDVWALSLGAQRSWTRLATGGPTPRMGMSVVLDTQHHRLVMFGGQDADGSYLDDLWMLPLGGTPLWEHVDVAGVRAGARTNHSAVYDEPGRRMIVFGGSDGSFGPLDETWSLSLDTAVGWTAITAPGAPTGRASHLAVLDPLRNRMLICSGNTGTSEYQTYVWALSLGASPAWSQTGPFYYYDGPNGVGYRAGYDSVNDAIVAFYPGYAQMYRFSLGGTPGWSILTVPQQPFDMQYAVGFTVDPTRGLAIVVGGHTSSSTEYRCDAWGLNLSGYSSWTEVFRMPYPRTNHSVAVDPIRHRMLVFGGYVRSSGNPSNELWALSLTEPPAWSPVVAAGTQPAPRVDASMTYDPVNDRMIVFGGYNYNQYTNELWSLSLAGTPTWTRLHPTGALPRERSNHAVAYDPTAHRMFVYGGSSNAVIADLWELSLDGPTAWRKLSPVSPAPSPRYGGAMVYDDVAARMLLVGGVASGYPYPDFGPGEVWAFDPALTVPTWSLLAAGAVPGASNGFCGAIFDPVGHRVLRVNRGGSYYYGGDTLRVATFRAGVDSTWQEVTTTGPLPSSSQGESFVYDALNNRVLVYGGTTSGGYQASGQTWALSFGTLPLPVPLPRGRLANPDLTLSVFPNPARGGMRLRIGVPSRGAVHVTVVDLQGRKVFERDLSDLPAGEHDVAVRLGAGVGPGVYFASCRGGASTATVRFAVVQ